MAQVYVSYGGKDRDAVLPVIEAMNQAGLDVWHYGMVSPVGPWLEQSRRELDKAQCVVVLWSKAAAQSVFLQQEVHHAIQAWSSDRLVLAALDDTPLPVGLRDLSPISIRKASDSGTKRLIERAQAIVEQAEAASAPMSRGDEGIEAEIARPAPSSGPPKPAFPPPRSHRFGWIVAAALLAGIVFLAGTAAIFLGNLASEPKTSSPPSHSQPSPSWFSPPDWIDLLLNASFWIELLNDPLALSVILTSLVLGIAIGVGVTLACTAWLRRRSKRAPAPILVQVPAVSDGVRVFVSYSRQDGRTVEQLVRQIEELGYAVWIDRQSSSAQRYAASIVGAIRTSKVVALMCSQNAFTSDHVIREVYVAGDYKKPFIVFQLDSTKFPDEILYFVSGFPRLPIATVDQQQLRSEIARLLAA